LAPQAGWGVWQQHPSLGVEKSYAGSNPVPGTNTGQ